MSRRYSHCAAKLVTIDSERGSASIRAHLPLEHRRVLQLSGGRGIQQLVVGNAAPEKERQPRGELEIADRDRACRAPAFAGSVLDAEQELRAHQHPLERPLNAAIESAFGPARGVERQQPLDVLRRWPDGGTRAATSVVRIFVGAREVVASDDGRLQTKMRRRLGVSPGPVTLYGPLIVTLAIAGCVPLPRIRGRSVSSSRAWLCSMNVTPTSRGPAFTGMRNSSGSAPPRPRLRPPRPAPLPRRPAAGSADVASCTRSPSTVISIWWASRRCAGDVEFDDVVAVQREVAADRQAAARPERQFIHARVLPAAPDAGGGY